MAADLAGLQGVHERPPHLHPNLCHVIKVLKCLSCFPRGYERLQGEMASEAASKENRTTSHLSSAQGLLGQTRELGHTRPHRAQGSTGRTLTCLQSLCADIQTHKDTSHELKVMSRVPLKLSSPASLGLTSLSKTLFFFLSCACFPQD